MIVTTIMMMRLRAKRMAALFSALPAAAALRGQALRRVATVTIAIRMTMPPPPQEDERGPRKWSVHLSRWLEPTRQALSEGAAVALL